MRWAQFKAQLPRSPAEALAAVDGALMGERADPQMTLEEREDAKTTRLQLMASINKLPKREDASATAAVRLMRMVDVTRLGLMQAVSRAVRK